MLCGDGEEANPCFYLMPYDKKPILDSLPKPMWELKRSVKCRNCTVVHFLRNLFWMQFLSIMCVQQMLIAVPMGGMLDIKPIYMFILVGLLYMFMFITNSQHYMSLEHETRTWNCPYTQCNVYRNKKAHPNSITQSCVHDNRATHTHTHTHNDTNANTKIPGNMVG